MRDVPPSLALHVLYGYIITNSPYQWPHSFPQTFNIRHLITWYNFWSLRCSWSIAFRRCSNYIFILDLTPGFNGLGKDNCSARRDGKHLSFGIWCAFILEDYQYMGLVFGCVESIRMRPSYPKKEFRRLPCIARPSAIMVILTIKVRRVPVFHLQEIFLKKHEYLLQVLEIHSWLVLMLETEYSGFWGEYHACWCTGS